MRKDWQSLLTKLVSHRAYFCIIRDNLSIYMFIRASFKVIFLWCSIRPSFRSRLFLAANVNSQAWLKFNFIHLTYRWLEKIKCNVQFFRIENIENHCMIRHSLWILSWLSLTCKPRSKDRDKRCSTMPMFDRPDFACHTTNGFPRLERVRPCDRFYKYRRRQDTRLK